MHRLFRLRLNQGKDLCLEQTLVGIALSIDLLDAIFEGAPLFLMSGYLRL